MLVHPEYEPPSLNSDVALLQLDSDLPLSDHTQLICLPSLPLESSLSLHCTASLENKHAGEHSQRSESVYNANYFLFTVQDIFDLLHASLT